MFVQSTVIKYGDHIDTDVIIPARYLNTTDHAELASHCMEDLDSDFKKKSETSRIIVAGATSAAFFPRAMRRSPSRPAAIQLVIADSFARIFYRNSIDIGLPIIECPAAAKAIRDGDEVAVNLDTGVIEDKTTAKALPPRRSRRSSRRLSPSAALKISFAKKSRERRKP